MDDAFAAGDWGRWTGGGHLQADSPQELHAFAARLGRRDAWFHRRSGRPGRDHYDVTAAGRREAIALGATPETWREGVLRRRSRPAQPATGSM